MDYFTTTVNFSNGDQVTSITLDQITSGMRLGSDSVDNSTITVAAGTLSLGVVGASNMGANSVTTNSILDANVTASKLATDSVETAKIKDAAVTNAKLLDGTILFVKLGAAALAAQADMQSETASKLAAAATMKFHPSLPKSYCVVTMATGALTGAYKATGTATGDATHRTINLGVTMANANYVPLITPIDTGGATGNEAAVTARTTTTITINGGATAYSVAILGQLG